jgi:hypothetical protein
VTISATADRFTDSFALGAATAFALWFVALAPLRRDAARERALDRGTPPLAAELLLADPNDANLKLATHAAPDGQAPGCSVTSPRECRAPG